MTSLTVAVPVAPPPASTRPTALLVGFDDETCITLSHRLLDRDLRVRNVPDTEDVRRAVALARPSVVLCQYRADDPALVALGRHLSADPTTADLPLVALGSRPRTRGARDRMTDSAVAMAVEVTRTVRPVAGSPAVTPSPARAETAALLDASAFEQTLESALAPSAGPRRATALAVLDVRERHSAATDPARREALLADLAATARDGASALETLGVDRDGRLLLMLRDRDALWVAHRLHRITEAVPTSGQDTAPLTPVAGWTPVEPGDDTGAVLHRADVAWRAAASHLDLEPVRWTAALEPRRPGRRARALTGLRGYGALALCCAALSVVLGVVLPLGLLVLADSRGVDLARWVHVAVTAALLVTAGSIWLEGLASLRRRALPPEPGTPPPPATAVIAAYLPNEADTVVETVESFLAVDYPDLQVVLAYNRPEPLPVEAELADLARRDPRLVVLPVTGSTSKAQNVNAALAVATGAFIGVFDADHHPAPDSFRRAHRWLEAGYDVVQGRCVVRNGDAGLVARTVAVEFESIYGVSHPGRARLHGFAIFGGSNGYWRTRTLHATRLRSRMLTEDIDSSVRLVLDGGRIVCDPDLVSRELAPTGVGNLWRQRLRWAQGWFQVSRSHRGQVRDNSRLSRRQKAGMLFLLRWRELNPWITQLVLPLVLFRLWQDGWNPGALLDSELLLLATLVTLSTAPGQVLFAWRAASPELRRRPGWFLGYLVVGSLVYTEWKNLAARVGQLLELVGVRTWVVTARS